MSVCVRIWRGVDVIRAASMMPIGKQQQREDEVCS